MTKEKVFCTKCVYYHCEYDVYGDPREETCDHKNNTEEKSTYLKDYKVFKKEPNELNWNNDCSNYESKKTIVEKIKSLLKLNLEGLWKA